MKISLIGTGLMGYPMAEKILENKLDLTAYNRTQEKALLLAHLGAKITKDSKEAIYNSNVIILMLSDYTVIKDILFDKKIKDVLNGKCILQMGTISPLENIELNKFCKNQQCEYLEAPVLGSINEVKNKKLMVLVGGEIELFKKNRFIFELFGTNIYFIGEVGKASVLKLALNQLIASLTAAFSLSLSYVKKNEIDTNVFMNILRESALYAPTFDKKLPNYENQNFDKTNFPLQHMLKDVKLIKNEVVRFNIDFGLLHAIEEIIEKAIQMGFKDKDYSSLYMGVYDK
jgi:3-hydroxyisobutyrate dehydrogenase